MSAEGSAKHDRRAGSGSNRMEKLLGIERPPPEGAAGDLYELGEEDVWGGADDAVVQYDHGLGAALSNGNGSMAPGLRHQSHSAPVNVPDGGWGTDDRKNEDMVLFEEEAMVPPHEYVARQRAMNSTALFAGLLKPPDLTRRHAVWSRTGFLD